MPRKPIGERAMSDTERSRRRLEKEAARLEAMKGAIRSCADQLLVCGRLLGKPGAESAMGVAKDCLQIAEIALAVANETPNAPLVMTVDGVVIETPAQMKQRKYAESEKVRRAKIRAAYDPLTYMAKEREAN